jgi:hypothetical protein
MGPLLFGAKSIPAKSDVQHPAGKGKSLDGVFDQFCTPDQRLAFTTA